MIYGVVIYQVKSDGCKFVIPPADEEIRRDDMSFASAVARDVLPLRKLYAEGPLGSEAV